MNTSDNALVKDLLIQARVSFKHEFETLLEGKTLEKFIDENVVFPPILPYRHPDSVRAVKSDADAALRKGRLEIHVGTAAAGRGRGQPNIEIRGGVIAPRHAPGRARPVKIVRVEKHDPNLLDAGTHRVDVDRGRRDIVLRARRRRPNDADQRRTGGKVVRELGRRRGFDVGIGDTRVIDLIGAPAVHGERVGHHLQKVVESGIERQRPVLAARAGSDR